MLTTQKIGGKIAESRKKMNISQAQLAQHLFISSQAVGKWERGESMPDITTFARLAEILGVDLNYFSDSFQYKCPEVSSDEPLAKQSAEMPPENQKLRWNMSRGNWVDADFSGLKNLHEKFSSSNMLRCKFIGSVLSGLLLKYNNVEGCDFSDSNLSKCRIQNSNLSRNLFNACSLKEMECSGSNISGCKFVGSDFVGAMFLKNNNIGGCDFSSSAFSSSHVQNSNLDDDSFKDCLFREAKFSGSYIQGCDFSGADFTGAVINAGGFQKNNVSNALWNRTSFIDSLISDVVFEGTMRDCYFENCAFKKVTFQNLTLVDTFFKNKSLKGIRFINCKADRMSYEFLKNGKADMTGVLKDFEE